MAVTYHTLTGDVTDILGVDFPLDRVTGASLETNLPKDAALVADGKVRLPSIGKLNVQADGTFSIANLVASDSADTNVDPDAPLLYRVSVRYRHPQTARARGGNVVETPVWSSPWFELNGSGTTTLANVVEVAYLPTSLVSQATATLEAARDDAVSDVQAAGTTAITTATTQANRAETEADRSTTEADRSEQAAADAEALVISDLGTTDGQTRALIEASGSQTRAALSAQQDTRFRNGAKALGRRALARVLGTLSEPAKAVTTVGALVAEATTTSASLGVGTMTAADDVVSVPTAHNLLVGDCIFLFGITGANLSAATPYYVQSIPSATTFKLATSPGGSVINITADGSATAVYRRVIAYDKITPAINPAFRVLNTDAVQGDTNFPGRDYLSPSKTAVTFSPGTAIGNYLTVETEVEGSRYIDLVVRFTGSGIFRVWVDDRLAATIPNGAYAAAGVANGGRARVPITLTDTRRHTIRFEGATPQQQFGGFEMGSGGRAYYPTRSAAKGPKALVVFDSFGDGAGSSGSSTSQDTAWWIAQMMGWIDFRRASSGGTGYFVDGARQSLADRYVNDVINQAPDQVLIGHGVNEHTQPLSSVVNAATTVYDGILSALPLVQLTVIGPWPLNGGVGTQPASILALDAALRQAVTSRGLQYISPIADGAKFALADTIHPNDQGHRDLATYVVGQMLMPTLAG